MKSHLISAIFFFMLSLAFSCSSERQQTKTHTFANANWHRFDILSFDLPVSRSEQEYTLFAILQYNDDFIHERLPLHCIMTYPSGEERIWEQTIVVREQNGESKGIRKAGVFELEIPIRARLSFRETGTARITIQQLIPKYDTPGIISFSLKLLRK